MRLNGNRVLSEFCATVCVGLLRGCGCFGSRSATMAHSRYPSLTPEGTTGLKTFWSNPVCVLWRVASSRTRPMPGVVKPPTGSGPDHENPISELNRGCRSPGGTCLPARNNWVGFTVAGVESYTLARDLRAPTNELHSNSSTTLHSWLAIARPYQVDESYSLKAW